LAALALAYLLPFELLVLSYAVLGPAHYLTEISWLHERKYFLPHRALALLLAATALGAMFIADPFWLGVLVSFSFVACAVLATVPRPTRALAILAIAAGCFALLCRVDPPFAIAWALVTTVIHVSVFTLVFMMVGAYKSKSAVPSWATNTSAISRRRSAPCSAFRISASMRGSPASCRSSTPTIT
jgi:hypothetical protein